MSRTMSATEARVHFGEVLRRVENNETITVERGGQPKAVIISIDQYTRLRDRQRTANEWEKHLTNTRERYLREARDVHYDVEGELRRMREERGGDFTDDLH